MTDQINNQQSQKNSEYIQKFKSFGTTLIILGAILIIPAILGAWFSVILLFSYLMSDYMLGKSSLVEITLFKLLLLYLIIAIAVTIYFIVVGSKLSLSKYSASQLHKTLIRTAILSFFWPIVGLVVLVISIIALRNWLPEYDKEQQNLNDLLTK